MYRKVQAIFLGCPSTPDRYFDNRAQALYGNIDASAEAESSIQRVGVTTLSTTDLIL